MDGRTGAWINGCPFVRAVARFSSHGTHAFVHSTAGITVQRLLLCRRI